MAHNKGSGGGAAAALPVALTAEESVTVAGTASWTDSGGAINVTVPSGSAMTTLSTARDFRVWDTGMTVDDIVGLPCGVRVTGVTGPAGSGAQIVLLYGLIFAPTTTADRSTEKSCWIMHHLGRSTDANTRSRVDGRNSNNGLTTGTTIDNHTKSAIIITMRSTPGIGSWQGRVDGDTESEEGGSIASALTGTDKVLVFLAADLSGTEASDQVATIAPEWMPPGCSWE